MKDYYPIISFQVKNARQFAALVHPELLWKQAEAFGVVGQMWFDRI